MNSEVVGLRVASVIFGLMSLAELLRLVKQPEVHVAGHQCRTGRAYSPGDIRWPDHLAMEFLPACAQMRVSQTCAGKHGYCLNITRVVSWFLGALVMSTAL